MKKTYSGYGISVDGKRTGPEIKTICPQCSHARKKKNYPCLNVNLEKEVWNCWHCGWGGSLKQGVTDPSNITQKKKNYVKPAFKHTDLPQNVIDWFKKRGISETVLKRNKIAVGKVYMPQLEEEVTAIQFPYYRQNEIVNIKYRDGKKNFRMASGAERILYGFDDITEKSLIIVEGEMDKLSCEMVGFRNVVSVPDGAPATNTKNYDKKFDFLVTAEETLSCQTGIILAVDADEPGQKLELELARRLGKERCSRVVWPDGCKDANEVLVNQGATELLKAIKEAKPYPINGIHQAIDLTPEIKRLRRDGYKNGKSPGWKTISKYYTVRPGEWTLVTGIPSHGKSEFVDALMVNLAFKEDWKFAVFSPENYPLSEHIKKLIEKFIKKGFWNINDTNIDIGIGMVDHYFSFILPDENDNQSLDSILNLAKILIFRKGIHGLVIDPWNEIEHSRPAGMTETEYISLCLTKIRKFARINDIHVWLVAHPTKLYKDKITGEYPIPTPYDVSGSANWRNKADNAITVWRNLKKEESFVQIHVQKIRFKNVGKVGMAELGYNNVTGEYYDL